MRRGFTLIEILIVIIIIGILATLLLPQIGGMTERARVAEAKSTLGAIRVALMGYYMENNTFPNAPACGINEIEKVLGDIIDENKSLFDYGWNASGNAEDNITVEAWRVDSYKAIAGDKKSRVEMVVEKEGSASMTVTWE